MKTIETKQKRLVVVQLSEGDDLYQSILEAAKEHNIRSGFIQGIGGLKVAKYGLYRDGALQDQHREAESCFELVSLIGNVSLKENEIYAHIHIEIADTKDTNQCFGGHLQEGSIIFPMAEIVIQEIDTEISRVYNDRVKLWPWNL